MNTANNVTAKVFGEILAKGMSLADCDMRDAVKNEAIDALSEIKNAVIGEKSDSDKLSGVIAVLERYMLI